MFSENNSLFNSNIINNNGLPNGLFNNHRNNDMTRLFTNFNPSNNISNVNNVVREPVRVERYVYISRTGAKYHGRPQCGRMKESTRVTLTKAESLGLTPCMKCY